MTYYSRAKHVNGDSRTKVITELEKAGNRAVWVLVGFGDYPGVAPEIDS